jgi:hypothetical protein
LRARSRRNPQLFPEKLHTELQRICVKLWKRRINVRLQFEWQKFGTKISGSKPFFHHSKVICDDTTSRTQTPLAWKNQLPSSWG